MSLIDSESCPCTKGELELFETKPTQTAILTGRYVSVTNTQTLDNTDTIEFTTTTGDEHYIDLSESTLYIKGKIVKSDNSDLKEKDADDAVDEAAMVYPVNFPIASFFKSCEVSLNGTQIGSSNTLYPYRALMTTLLSYSADAKAHQLAAGGFNKDLGSKKEDLEETGARISDGSATNKGAVNRFSISKYSKEFELEGLIFNEVWQCGKLLLSKTQLGVRMTLASPKFCLMSHSPATDYKVKLTKARLHLSIKEVASYVRLAHEERLLKDNAKYPVTRVEMRTFLHSTGVTDLNQENLSKGEIARRIVLGVVETNAINGALDKNPFNFHHFNISSVKLTVSGREIPYGELKLDFANKNVLDGYMSIFRGCKLWQSNTSNDISQKNYRHGHTFFVFNLAGDDSGDSVFQLQRSGDVALEIKLSEATEVSTTIVVLFEYDAFFEVDHFRNVHYTHSGSMLSM